MEFKDYYNILGVSPESDDKEIKTAYRKLARKYHPDMNSDEGAEDQFKEVAEAYEVLKDSARRAEFDELRQYGSQTKQGFEPPPGWQSDGFHSQGGQHFEGDFSEFFNSMFGGGGNTSRRSGGYQDQRARGQDVELEMPIFLEETISETTKTVEFSIPVLEGGKVSNMKKHLKVKIPKWVADGERIRLRGQGSPGVGSGAAGDLYLHIRLVPHPLFDVEGHNLLLALPVAPWEAALGTKVTIPTLNGKISLTLPPNTQAGKKLRIKGKGLSGKGLVGDLYAIVKIVMPPSSDEASNLLWKELSSNATFDPRKEWSNES